MDEIMVGLIIAGAVAFTIKRFIDTYRGEKTCGCGKGCACAAKKECPSGFQEMNRPKTG